MQTLQRTSQSAHKMLVVSFQRVFCEPNAMLSVLRENQYLEVTSSSWDLWIHQEGLGFMEN